MNDSFSILLDNLENMAIKTESFNVQSRGNIPELRPIDEYLKYGVITLDKPQNPSSHEVVSWIKNILDAEKTGHSGTLDPMVSGCLTICLNRATRLVKSQQSAGKEYVCVIEFHGDTSENEFKKVLKKLTGVLIQRPPLMCAVKRNIRLRTIYNIDFLEFDAESKLGLFKVSCEAGTYIRTLCTHIGIFLGCGAHMKELRRTRSGISTEDTAVTLHDVLDAMHLYKTIKEEKYLRKVIKPLESLLIAYPRIIVKDSSVEAICHGARLTIPGVLRYDKNITLDKDILLITTKGEAIALAKPLMTSPEIKMATHGMVAKPERLIMEKGVYEKAWSFKKEYDIESDS
ncbi:tRNA pseudouridine synthase [Spraguea lophii 42_110]|uniref:H/ACA ribonucleoprotein complex subunit CBF5 n=1 Tax=Spraguea lophii (strain 42_110) TaxID=1358809 RepID=S7WAA0_SPRLO|nr:tRNA pseudouridine synthase [Spraguea lophii 42_110]